MRCAREAVAAPDERFLAPIKFNAATLARQLPAVRARMDDAYRSLETGMPGEAA